MKVLILAAGQGKRLLPLTNTLPKALLKIGERALIARQIDAFAACGIEEFVVITGYGTELVEEMLGRLARDLSVEIRTIFNPFYRVADNLASCWMARHEMKTGFIQVNGDTIFRAELVRHFLSCPSAPIRVAINHKEHYDNDDMKVMLKGERIVRIGKTLPSGGVDAEAVGLYRFGEDGAGLYRDVLERTMRDGSGIGLWFPSAVSMIAENTEVASCAIDGHDWCEVDTSADLHSAGRMVSSWPQ